MTEYDSLVGAMPAEDWEDRSDVQKMVLELGALVSSVRLNSKTMAGLLDRTEAIAFSGEKRRCAVMAKALHDKAVEIQLKYVLSLTATGIPLTVSTDSPEYLKQSSLIVDAAYGIHCDSTKASKHGRWNTVDCLEDVHLRRAECLHEVVSRQNASTAAGQVGSCRPKCSSAALILSRITTPATARAFQAVQCSMKRVAQLAKDLQKVPESNMSPTVLAMGVDMARDFTTKLARLAGARRDLKEVPKALEHSADHAIRAATWHAWEEACDLARKRAARAQPERRSGQKAAS
jgi:hypothetical protein